MSSGGTVVVVVVVDSVVLVGAVVVVVVVRLVMVVLAAVVLAAVVAVRAAAAGGAGANVVATMSVDGGTDTRAITSLSTLGLGSGEARPPFGSSPNSSITTTEANTITSQTNHRPWWSSPSPVRWPPQPLLTPALSRSVAWDRQAAALWPRRTCGMTAE